MKGGPGFASRPARIVLRGPGGCVSRRRAMEGLMRQTEEMIGDHVARAANVPGNNDKSKANFL